MHWVNDDETKRAYNQKSDAYTVFQKILHNGNQPSDWDSLQKEAEIDCVQSN